MGLLTTIVKTRSFYPETCSAELSGPLVAEPWEPLGGLGGAGTGTSSSPGTPVQCRGTPVQCRATRGRASPDIIPVTHICHFPENVSLIYVLFHRMEHICLFKVLPLETIGKQVQG